MLFHSAQFAVFFAVVYLLYRTLPHFWQNRMLLVGSYVFYGSWDWRFLSLLMISTIVDYFCGIGIEGAKDRKTGKRFVALSVIVNLSMLGTFKYYDFFAGSFQELLGNFGFVVQPYFLDIALPIGISFYTFQTMGYTIDVFRGKLPAQRNLPDFALYVSFFPQLIAGPIERGARLLPQITEPRKVTKEHIAEGLHLIFWGLFLKVLIADNLAPVVDEVYGGQGPYSAAWVLLATYAFAFQIFCDFAGYSWMAIGLALLMGVRLVENFRRPYFSPNIGDFWRRWHISLSSWFRDYVFSPFFIYLQRHRWLKLLPMRRRHAVAFFVTLFCTEYLLGLWHGAGWNYGAFGLYHAVLIWSYYQWHKMNGTIQVILTFHLVCLGWLIFRSPTLGQAWDMSIDLVINWQVIDREFLVQLLKVSALISALFVVQVFEELKDDRLALMRLPRPVLIPLYAGLGVLILTFGHFGERKFIYFQF